MEPEPVVRPADIRLASDGSGRLVLVLDLPCPVAKLFVDDLPSVAARCSVYRLPVGFFVGFVVLQVQAHQVRVVAPLYDEKSFSWLEQCLSLGTVSYMFTSVDAGGGQRFDVPTDFPALLPDNLAQMRRFSSLVPEEDVLLVIASSIPSMAQPRSVASLFPDFSFEEVRVCIVRDFFNTDACAWAAAGLTG